MPIAARVASRRAKKYEAQAQDLTNELEIVRSERSDWDRRIALLRSDQIDRDLLEEKAASCSDVCTAAISS